MVPIFMSFRFLWSLNWPPLAKVLFWINRVGAFVLLIPSTVVLLMYGFKVIIIIIIISLLMPVQLNSFMHLRALLELTDRGVLAHSN
jgi:hypothetical protein